MHAEAQTYMPDPVFFETDRDLYLNGETLYFSAFLKDYEPEENNISTVLYVEIFNKREVIVQRKYRIYSKIVNGAVEIPQESYSGNYLVRAYTKWERNRPAEQMHTQLISIINPDKTFPKEDLCKLPLLDYTVEDNKHERRYFFRMNQPFNNCRKIILTGDSGQIIKQFNASEGCLFTFQEELSQPAVKNLSIVENGDTVRYEEFDPMPSNKVSVTYETTPNLVKFYCQADASVVSRYGQDTRFLLKNSRMETVADRLADINENTPLIFERSVIQTPGIYYMILQNFSGQTIDVSAAYFGNSPQSDSPRSDGIMRRGRREKVSPDVKFSNPSEMTVVKVADSRLFLKHYDGLPLPAIYSHVLLRHFIQNKAAADEALIRQINTALAFQKDEINSQNFIEFLFFKASEEPEILPDIRDVSIVGRAVHEKSGKPAADIDIFASVAYGKNQLHHTRTDKDGRFVFSLSQACNLQNVFITAGKQDSDVKISVLNDFHADKPFIPEMPLAADTSLTDLFRQLYISKQLTQVFSRPILHDTTESCFGLVNFEGLQDYSVRMEDYIKLGSVAEIFHEIVPRTELVKRNHKTYIRIYNESLRDYADNPLVLIDFMPVFDMNKVYGLDPERPVQIDVINQTFVIGNYRFDGVVLIHTNTKDFGGIELPERAVYFKYTGSSFQTKPVFPEYHRSDDRKKSKPDFRNILFFRSLKGDPSASIEFFSSDAAGAYDIIMISLRPDGTTKKTIQKLIVD